MRSEAIGRSSSYSPEGKGANLSEAEHAEEAAPGEEGIGGGKSGFIVPGGSWWR